MFEEIFHLSVNEALGTQVFLLQMNGGICEEKKLMGLVKFSISFVKTLLRHAIEGELRGIILDK